MRDKEYKIGCDCGSHHCITFRKSTWSDGEPLLTIDILGQYMCLWGRYGRLWQAIKLIFSGDCFLDDIVIREKDLRKIKKICDKLLT